MSALLPLRKRMNIDGIDFIFRIIAATEFEFVLPRRASFFTYHPGIISGAVRSPAALVNVCVIWQFVPKKASRVF